MSLDWLDEMDGLTKAQGKIRARLWDLALAAEAALPEIIADWGGALHKLEWLTAWMARRDEHLAPFLTARDEARKVLDSNPPATLRNAASSVMAEMQMQLETFDHGAAERFTILDNARIAEKERKHRSREKALRRVGKETKAERNERHRRARAESGLSANAYGKAHAGEDNLSAAQLRRIVSVSLVQNARARGMRNT